MRSVVRVGVVVSNGLDCIFRIGFGVWFQMSLVGRDVYTCVMGGVFIYF